VRYTFSRIVALVAVLTLGSAAAPAQAITFGQPDGDRHPNVGVFLADFRGTGVLEPFCSGTLIAPTVFLTAGHCSAYLESIGVGPSEVAVSFAAHYVPGQSPIITGTYHTNPGFPGPLSDPNDVSVITLDQAAGQTPAELPTAGLLDRTALSTRNFTAVGYGALRNQKCCGGLGIVANDGTRRFVTQGFLSLQKAWLTLSMNPSTGSGGTCYGDSGGPHFLGGPTSNLVVSITSIGDAVCRATDKTYRLDTPSARGFLSDFVTLP
jgi:hypothetical protein